MVREVVNDLFLLFFEGISDVVDLSCELVLLRLSLDFILLFSNDQTSQMILLSSLDDGGGRESEMAGYRQCYLATLFAMVKTVLIISHY
jgi:hypothetical protein